MLVHPPGSLVTKRGRILNRYNAILLCGPNVRDNAGIKRRNQGCDACQHLLRIVGTQLPDALRRSLDFVQAQHFPLVTLWPRPASYSGSSQGKSTGAIDVLFEFAVSNRQISQSPPHHRRRLPTSTGRRGTERFACAALVSLPKGKHRDHLSSQDLSHVPQPLYRLVLPGIARASRQSRCVDRSRRCSPTLACAAAPPRRLPAPSDATLLVADACPPCRGKPRRSRPRNSRPADRWACNGLPGLA